MSKRTIIFIAFYLLFVALYGSFKIGKWHERQHIKGILQSMYMWTSDADFIIPPNIQMTLGGKEGDEGDTMQGNCIYGPGIAKQTELSREVGFF